MEIFISGIIFSIFGYINFQILYSDFQEKKIPNKRLGELLLLLPFWYIFISTFGYFGFIFSWSTLLAMCISLIVCFGLYYYHVWGAGDSKYIFILSLYAPSANIIILLGNTALFTVVCMLIYFLYFFTLKLGFQNSFRNKIKANIKQDMGEMKQGLIQASGSFTALFNLIAGLFIIYAGIRFVRIIVLQYINNNELLRLWEAHTEYIAIFVIIFFIFLIYAIRLSTTKLFVHLEQKGYQTQLIKTMSLYCMIIGLGALIYFQLQSNNIETKKILFLLSTIYLAIYIIVLGGKYFILLAFNTSERNETPLHELKAGMILDTKHTQHLLQGREILADDMEFNVKTKILDSQSIQALKKTIKYINLGIQKNNKNEDTIKGVVTMKTISYGIFIYIGFLITIIFGSTIISILLDILQELFIK